MQHSSEFTPPPWSDDLRDLEAQRRAEKVDARAKARPAGNGAAGPVSDGRGRSWTMAALESEAAAVAGAVNGRRNHTLNVAALKLGGIVAGTYLGADEVRDPAVSGG